MFDLQQLESMSEREERRFWACCLRLLRHDDGEAAMAHLREGRPIYYCDDDVPDGLIREWPNGRKEVVQVLEDSTVLVVGRDG